MKKLLLLTAVLALGFTLTLATTDAEAARRFGSGKSFGMQRQANIPSKSPAAAPAQATASSAAKAQPGAAQTPPKRSWMGPIAGLAAGLGLAALASHFGFGEALSNMLMIGLLVIVAVAAIGFFMRRRAAAQQVGTANMGNTQYATASLTPVPMNRSAHETALPASGAGVLEATSAASYVSTAASTAHIPTDFDVAGFERTAKVNFIRLQAANDTGNLDDIRAFTAPEVFAEIQMSIAERGAITQVTDVLSLEVSVIDVAEEPSRYIVSVRFSGQIREDNEPAEGIDEIWHMTKPRDGSSGWLLAGIRQV